ncbi:hypothetical protein [Bacteroides ovatus]|jgi:hypothetical protein|uniref:hypothetical protein n=1 Tax=Bacteroides ovatus TaxID=28116 RepID=UPI0020A82128|nr:hypothetical protein [Bacteroides ovatus]CAG9922112.1 hypothetical protein BOVA208_1694 [Bacteroides ovatus]
MKKFLLTIAIVSAFSSCSEESSSEQTPTEVEVSLDFSFTESGSMTRTGSTAYTDFYNKYIKTKQLTPKNFDLTFTNKETGATATIRGNWNKKHSFKLLTGEYEVTGISHPYTLYSGQCIDSLYLKFNENITITNNTESVNLTVIYDSFMTIFDKNDKSKIEFVRSSGYPSSNPTEIALKNVDNVFYAFFNEEVLGNVNSIYITRNKTNSIIKLDDIPFEKGKYYYFNDIDNSFNIPPMEEGN